MWTFPFNGKKENQAAREHSDIKNNTFNQNRTQYYTYSEAQNKMARKNFSHQLPDNLTPA